MPSGVIGDGIHEHYWLSRQVQPLLQFPEFYWQALLLSGGEDIACSIRAMPNLSP